MSPDLEMSNLRNVFASSTLTAARAVLGARLVREDADGRRVGRIVEVEAYIGEDDRASHARFGLTARNAVMYGPPGVAYVYLVYGMHDCLNIVTEPTGRPAALLVRAVEPLEGIDLMSSGRRRRGDARRRSRLAAGTGEGTDRPLPALRLASGPGLVCAAFDLDRSLTGLDLLDPEAVVRIEAPPAAETAPRIVAGRRVGIAYAGEPWISRPWRLAIADHPSVSRPVIGDAPGDGDGDGDGGERRTATDSDGGARAGAVPDNGPPNRG